MKAGTNYQDTIRGRGAPAGGGARAWARRVTAAEAASVPDPQENTASKGPGERGPRGGRWPAAAGTTPPDSRDKPEAVCVCLPAALDLGFVRWWAVRVIILHCRGPWAPLNANVAVRPSRSEGWLKWADEAQLREQNPRTKGPGLVARGVGPLRVHAWPS